MLLESARTANLYPVVSFVGLMVELVFMFGGFFSLILVDFVGCLINMGNMVNVLPCSSYICLLGYYFGQLYFTGGLYSQKKKDINPPKNRGPP